MISSYLIRKLEIILFLLNIFNDFIEKIKLNEE
jgi:hypothetical protein